MNNHQLKQLGDNIKALRNAYGETQQDLGKAINVEHNTISSYETCRTEPDKSTLVLISSHYNITLDELINGDFSRIKTLSYEPDKIWKDIEKQFPYIVSDNAMRCESFAKAYHQHRKIFEDIKNINGESMERLLSCMDNYLLAYEYENAKVEAAANMVCIWYFIYMLITVVPTMIEKNSVAVTLISKLDPHTALELEEMTPEWLELKTEMATNPEFNEQIEKTKEYLKVVKQSSKWAELADYYIATQYRWNIVNNKLEFEFNRKIGIELLHTYAYLGNKYAIELLNC